MNSMDHSDCILYLPTISLRSPGTISLLTCCGVILASDRTVRVNGIKVLLFAPLHAGAMIGKLTEWSSVSRISNKSAAFQFKFFCSKQFDTVAIRCKEKVPPPY
jgi:hypothetical protein